MKGRVPSHTTIAAYLALFIAMATGGAYAIERVGSKDVANNSLKSADLKNRKAVRGKDVAKDSLSGKQIDESRLNGSQLVSVAGANDVGDCDPASETVAVDCASAGVQLTAPARIVAIGTGGFYNDGASGASAGCDIRVNDVPRSAFAVPGESTNDTSGGATDGFSRTLVTADPLPAGNHKVALACREIDPDARISTPTLAVFAITAAGG